MRGEPPLVHIHYKRLPDREDVFVQRLLLDAPDVKVTFQPDTPISGPVQVQGRTVLEPGSPVVWFTFPGAWHDVGRFHTADGGYTGLYANVLTPCRLHRPGSASPLEWHTTDLFLDVWMGPDGSARILDQPDFEAAVREGSVAPSTAARALREARRLRRAAGTSWPPKVVQEWTLAKARAAVEAR